MAYQPTLLNRLSQFGRVNYDLLLTDDAQVLPTIRIPFSVTDNNDTIQGRAVIARKIITDRANWYSQSARLKRLQDYYQSLADRISALQDERAAIQAAITAGNY